MKENVRTRILEVEHSLIGAKKLVIYLSLLMFGLHCFRDFAHREEKRGRAAKTKVSSPSTSIVPPVRATTLLAELERPWLDNSCGLTWQDLRV